MDRAKRAAVKDLTTVPAADRQVVQSYGGGGFKISGVAHVGSVIVLPEAVLPWPVSDVYAVDLETLSPVIDLDPSIEILLLGTGANMRPASPELHAGLKEHGIVADAMDTGAACRTFNVLVAEDRRVAAALIAHD